MQYYEQMKITYNESIKNTTKLCETESTAKNSLQRSEHAFRMLYDKVLSASMRFVYISF